MAEEITSMGALQPDAGGAKESIMVLVPMAGPAEARFVQTAMVAVAVGQRSGLNIDAVCIADREVVQAARNHLADAFLKSNCEWSMWFDSDMVIPEGAIPRLWRWAKKMKGFWMTGCYYQRYAPHHPVMFRLPPRNHEAEGHSRFNHEHTTYSGDRKYPFELDCAGFGCMLVHRKVFEAIEKPYFKFTTNPDKPTEESSEDFWFCKQARKAGFVLYGVPEVECGHIGTAPVYGRKDYEKCRTVTDYIETREQYKETPFNGRATESTGRSEDAGSQKAAGQPELAKEAVPSNF